MVTTLRELRELIAENCDFSQPLRIIAHDVGKKAARHSTLHVDESFPTKLSVARGKYDARGVIEFAYDPEGTVLMPEAALEALDKLMEEVPKATIGWVYFFYYPLDYKGFLGRVKRIKDCLLDTSSVKNVYFADDQPNTLVIEAAYGVGSFDM